MQRDCCLDAIARDVLLRDLEGHAVHIESDDAVRAQSGRSDGENPGSSANIQHLITGLQVVIQGHQAEEGCRPVPNASPGSSSTTALSGPGV